MHTKSVHIQVDSQWLYFDVYNLTWLNYVQHTGQSTLSTHLSLYCTARSSPGEDSWPWQTAVGYCKWASCVYVRMCTNVSEHMRNRVKRAVGLHLLYSLKRADELRAGRITDICLKEKEKNCTVTTQLITTHGPRRTVLSVRWIFVSTYTNKSAKGAEKSNWIKVKDRTRMWCLLGVAHMAPRLQSPYRHPTKRQIRLSILCIISAYALLSEMNMFCVESGTDPSEGGGEDRALLTSLKGISVNKQTHQSAILQHDDERKQWQWNNSNRFIKWSAINISFCSSTEQRFRTL